MSAAFTSRARRVTDADVLAFAALTGDWHPQHVDPAWAASSTFGERIAHGMLVVSLAIGLVDFDPERVLALRGLREVTFKRAVLLGDTIHVEGAVSATRPLADGRALETWTWRIVNQDGQLVCRMVLEALCREVVEA